MNSEYNKNNKLTYFEYSDDYWVKYERDKNNNVTYFKNSRGYINIGTWNNGIEITINE